MTATGTEARLPGADAVLPLAAHENFPVALRVLGRRAGAHLLAIYGFARLVDQVGDEMAGDRLVALDTLDADLARVWDGEPHHPLLRRLQPTVRACGMPREPFLRLVEANRQDQVVSRYATYEELAAYCDLSANPVGELVLYAFGCATPDRISLSDRVCTGLQLVEHWQDVPEDYRRGRIYLPADDMARFGVGEHDLGEAHANVALRELLAFEVARARALLDEGALLVRLLPWRARVAVAGYVGGGRANADAIERHGYDVLPGPPKASGARKLVALARAFA
ncbi:MAG: squalene synthase HpnC [Actinobacteria bacterium]|nr:squalene synthase HpnC [Actinomycetota bacterium]